MHGTRIGRDEIRELLYGIEKHDKEPWVDICLRMVADYAILKAENLELRINGADTRTEAGGGSP